MAKLFAWAIFAATLGFFALAQDTSAQSTEFTYQGSLKDNASPANANYDFEFALFDTPTGGSQLGPTLSRNGTPVANGIFSVKLDFGQVFPGSPRYLEIRVKLTGQPNLTPLLPRQPMNSAPYSIKSLSSETAANATQLGGLGPDGFIHNTTVTQPSSNFNVSANGTVGGNFITNGRLGVGVAPFFKLHVEDSSNTGLRVQTNATGGTVASFGGNGDVQVDAPGIAGGRFVVKESGRVGIGITDPQQVLHVNGNEILSTGFQGGYKFRDRGSVSANDDWVWYSNNNLARFFRAGVGDLLSIKTNGDVGIGTSNPSSKLTVQGTVQSTAGGFMFPDGSVQTSASAVGSMIYTTKQTTDLAMVGWQGSDTTVLHLNLPNGNYQLTATVGFRNEANFFAQDNHRFFICKFSPEPGGNNDYAYHYNESVAGLFTLTTTFHSVVTVSNGGVDLLCHAFYDLPTSVIIRQRRMTAVPITGTLIVQ